MAFPNDMDPFACLTGLSGGDCDDAWGEYRDEEDETKIETLRRSATLAVVDAVTSSDVVQNLEQAAIAKDVLLDRDAQEQYRQVLGMVPVDLMNKGVQAQMIRDNPEYKHAFESRLMLPFLQGISKASFRMCNGIMLAAVARCLLDEVLSQMGLNASARSDLVELGKQLQYRMVGLAKNTQEFVETMAMATKELGKVATLLEYGAGTEVLLGKMRNMSLAIDARREALKQSEEETLEPLIQVTLVIQQYMQSDTKFQEEKDRLETRQMELYAKTDRVVDLYNEYWNERTDLETNLARNKQELANNGVMQQLEQRQIARLETNLREMDKVIQRYENLKVNYQEDHREELKSSKRMIHDLQVSMKNVAQARQTNWEEQMKSLRKLQSGCGSQVLMFREASQNASDGVEVRETTNTNSCLWGLFSNTTTNTEVIQHPNEKLRLEQLAEKSQRNFDELGVQIRELEQNGSSKIVAEMKALMANDFADAQKRAAEEKLQDRLQGNLDSVDKQIGSLQKLQDSAQQDLNSHKSALGMLMERQENLVAEGKDNEVRLAELQSEESGLNKRIQVAKQEEADAAAAYETQRQILASYVDTFGEQNDFAVFMRLFSLLNGSVKNLPMAMETMSNAFKAVEITFGHDIFQENLDSLPEAGQRRMLKDVSEDMQNVCIAAWDTFEAPLIKLVQTETRAVLDPIVRQSRRKQMLESAERMRDEDEQTKAIQGPSGVPIIEEAE